MTADAPRLGLRAWPVHHTTAISCGAEVKSAGGREGQSQVHVVGRVGYCAGFNQCHGNWWGVVECEVEREDLKSGE